MAENLPASDAVLWGKSWNDIAQKYAPDLLLRHNDEYPGGNVTVIGSFTDTDWGTDILPARERLRAAGFWVLAPLGDTLVDYATTEGTLRVVGADFDLIGRMQERLGRTFPEGDVLRHLTGLSRAAIEASDFTYFAGEPKPDASADDMVRVRYGLRVALDSRRPLYGTPIRTTFDQQQCVISGFPDYVRNVQYATPEELGERYRQGIKL